MNAEALVAKGKKQGFVTYEEITGLYPDPDEHLDDIDGLCISLIEQGVEIVSAASVQEMLASIEPELKPKRRRARRPKRAKPLDDFYNLYLQEIRKVPLLKREEEVELAKCVQRGISASRRLQSDSLSHRNTPRLHSEVIEGERARRRFVESNLRLVPRIAWRYRDQGLPLLDLIQEGNIGLIRAVEKFDHRLGYRFSTYASWWIRQSVTRAIADHGNTIRLPVHVLETRHKVDRAAEELRSQLGQQPTREQLAQFCEISQKQLSRVLDGLPETCSLDSLFCCPDFPLVWSAAGIGLVQQKPCPAREFADRRRYLASEDDDFELPPCLGESEKPDSRKMLNDVDYSLISYSSTNVSPKWRAFRRSLQKRIREVLSSLSDRERTVIELRYGLDDGEEQTLEEVGQEFGVTRERIRQIQNKALIKLKHPIRRRKLMSFWKSD